MDIAPSFAFDSVTYVDSDSQAARFFADRDGVDEIINRHRQSTTAAEWRFIAADYRFDFGLVDRSYGLLVSLYASFVSEHCTRYLRPGGWLLVNPSHADAAMASVDSRYRLFGVINARSGDYSISRQDLDTYLVPNTQRPQGVRARGARHQLTPNSEGFFRLFSAAKQRMGLIPLPTPAVSG